MADGAPPNAAIDENGNPIRDPDSGLYLDEYGRPITPDTHTVDGVEARDIPTATSPYGIENVDYSTPSTDDSTAFVTSPYGVGQYNIETDHNDRRNRRITQRREDQVLGQLESDFETQAYVDAYGRTMGGLDELGGLQDALQGMDSQQAAGWRDQIGNAAMLRSLRQMEGIADAGGYTPLERAQIQQAQYQADLAAKSNREALKQQMAMRGMGGSGMEYAGALHANQAGANAARANATNVALAGQQRALNAMQSAYTMGQGRAQTQANAGAAADAWNQQNFQNQAAVTGANQAHYAQQSGNNQAQEAQDAEKNKKRWEKFTDAVGGIL